MEMKKVMEMKKNPLQLLKRKNKSGSSPRDYS